MIRNNLNDLYTPIFDELTIESFGAELESRVALKELFDVKTDDSKEVKVSSISGLGVWEDMDESDPVPQEELVQMYDETFTHAKKGKAITMSFESVDDDEYAVLGEKSDKARAMGAGAVDKVEDDCMNIFNLHTTTAGADGVALVDAQHPKNPDEATTYYDNELTGASSALDHDALEDMETLIVNNLKNPKGLPIPIPSMGLLLVPPILHGTALRLCSERATSQPDTAERNINIYAGKYKVVMSRYLTTSDTAWWIVFPSLKGLRFYWRNKPHYDHHIDYATSSYVWDGTMRYSVGWTGWGWRSVWGSVGA